MKANAMHKIDLAALDIKRLPATERYLCDPQYHYLVDMLCAQIHTGQYTPTELREAVILAATKYEMQHGRSYLLPDHEIIPFDTMSSR